MEEAKITVNHLRSLMEEYNKEITKNESIAREREIAKQKLRDIEKFKKDLEKIKKEYNSLLMGHAPDVVRRIF